MKWTAIKYCGDEVLATNFLDGVVVGRLPPEMHDPDVPSFFIPGWRIKLATGDADAPSLVRRGGPTSEYKIRFVLDE